MAFYNKLLQSSIFSVLEERGATWAQEGGRLSGVASAKDGPGETGFLNSSYSSPSVASLTIKAGFPEAPNLLIASFLQKVHHPPLHT